MGGSGAMQLRLWTFVKRREAARRFQRLENKPFELLPHGEVDEVTIDLMSGRLGDGSRIPKGATDFGAISRIEIDERGQRVLELDAVPLLEAALPRLKDRDDSDLGLWPAGYPERPNFSAWQTLRAGWPGASYLRVIRDDDALSAYLRLQLHIPILPINPRLPTGVSTNRANELVSALFGEQHISVTSREDWSELHYGRPSSLSAISLVLYGDSGLPDHQRQIEFQGLASHTSLARFFTQSPSAQDNRLQFKEESAHRAADGQFIFDASSVKDAVDALGRAADGCTPLTRYGLVATEAGVVVDDAGGIVASRFLEAETVPILEVLGLEAAPVLARDGAGDDKSVFPYQQLHLRSVAKDLEWLTWIKLSHPEASGASNAGPCLLRCRQLETSAAGVKADYTVSLEGLSGAHVLHIWSQLAAKPARNQFARDYGKKIPSLLSELFVQPGGEILDEPGGYVVTITGARTNNGIEFLGQGQTTLDLQPDEIRTITIRRIKDPLPTPSEPFPPAPTEFDDLIVSGDTWVRFPDMRDTGNRMVIVRTGEIAFSTDELTFHIKDGEWALAQDVSVELANGPVIAGETLELAISSIDFELQQRLRGDKRASLHLKTDGSFGVKHLRIPIATAWVRGTDADAASDKVLGLRLERQAAVWSTSSEALLKGGELALQHQQHDEGRQSTFDIYRGTETKAVSGGASLEFAIVDPAPFFVGAVSLQAPRTDAPGQDERLASWNSSEARWRLLWFDKTIPENRLRLPPQGRAEDWERVVGERDRIVEGGRVGARFTRTAVVKVQAEERLRAPTGSWNIVETLTDAKADLPGARMTAVERLEILYGLEAHGGRTDNLRIAETESWRGRPALLPVEIKDLTTEASRAKDWQTADRLWAERLAVIEARKDYPGTGELIEDLPYRLRRKQADGAEYAKPLVWQLKDEPTAPPDLVEYDHPEDWFTDGGSTGGVFGGFERAEVLDALIRDADTGLGTMRELALSARGATSDGDATFGTGLTRIAFKSELGRLTEVRFERMGRISWFRNKARHVVVYRLRATPSKQFSSKQNKHQGRLLIRKDEEFVELIEPVRGFPGRDTGPLEHFEFRDRKIRVDGAWSHGLGEGGPYRGYALPLWRPEADPAIYPRPASACHMAGPNGDVYPRSVSNPDIIHFYSLTEMEGAAPSGDTETWPNVYGLDYADRRLDEPLADNVAVPSREDFGAPQDAKRPLPAEPLVVPGLEDFTLLLENGQPVNLMASRPADPVYTDMRSLVVMRAAHSHPPGEERPTQPAGVSSGQTVVRQSQRLADVARNRSPSGWTLASLKTAIAETRNGVDAFPSSAESIANRILGVADEPLKRLEELSKRLAKVDDPAELKAMWNSGRQQLIDQLVGLEREIGSIMPVGEHLYAEAERLLRLDESETKLREEIGDFLIGQAAQVDVLCTDLLSKLGGLKNEIMAAFGAVSAELEKATPHFATARQQAALAAKRIEQISAQVQQRLRQLPDHAAKVEDLARKYGGRVPALAQFAQRLAAELSKAPQLAQRAAALEARLRADIDGLVGLIDLIEREVADAKTDAKDALEELQSAFVAGFDADVIAPVTAFRKRWHTDDSVGTLAPVVLEAQAIIDKVINTAKRLVENSKNQALDKVATAAHELLGEVLAVLQLARVTVGAADPPDLPLRRLAALANDAKSKVDTILDAYTGFREELSEALSLGLDTLQKFADDAVEELQGLEDFLDELIAKGAKVEEAYEEIAKQIDLFEDSACRFAEGVNTLLDEKARKDLLKPLEQRVKADNLQEAVGLRLLRGCGAPPVVENLIFNREQIGYHYRAEYDRLVTTPMTALVDQGQEVLRAFGVTQPVLGFGADFLSPVSGAFDDVKGAADQVLANLKMQGNEVLRDLAGLKKIFPSMPYDKALAKAITVKHGFDPASGQAWLLAKLDHKIGKQPIFEQEMFSLLAQNARLTAEARFEQPVTGGEQSATSKAEVEMDIIFMIGGTQLLAVRDAKVLFNSDGLKFTIRPEKIEFNKLLQLVSDAIRSLTGEDSPLQLELLIDEESGRPIGLASKYDLPPVSFGPILNASLGVHLILAQRETFRIESLAYLGNKDAPFALVYGILGGGGYIEAKAAHIPETGRTDLAIHISIGASAGTGFSFGPLRGSVSTYLGFTLDYISRTGGERLIIGAVLVVNGSVRAWSIVTVSLQLRLAITYDGRQMLGVGRVTVTVKISRFYKKKFRRSIRYRP